MISHTEKSQNTYTMPPTSSLLISVQTLTEACLSPSPPPTPHPPPPLPLIFFILSFVFLTLPRSSREPPSLSVHLPLVSISQHKGNILLFSIKCTGVFLRTSAKEKYRVKPYFQKLSSAEINLQHFLAPSVRS